MRQTSLIDATWIEVKDGDDTAREIFSRHYTFRSTRSPQPNGAHWLIVGPGEKLVLLTPCARALFVWRRERYRMDQQGGVNCAVFRNEGAGVASDLIIAADNLAWERWPGERLFTFVDPAKGSAQARPRAMLLTRGLAPCRLDQNGPANSGMPARLALGP